MSSGSQGFQDAAAYLSSAPSLSKVSSSVKLELYGLFKYITVSKSPNTSRPSIFDMTGRAKWDAWEAAGKKYESTEGAEGRYLEVAKSLGWTETQWPSTSSALGSAVEYKKPEAVADDVDLENLSDDEECDNAPQSSRNEGGDSGGGLGVSVSRFVQAAQPKAVDASVHGLALDNDTTGLKLLLDSSPGEDLDALDEYGYAPIHLACDRGNAEVVKLLLEKGARRDVKDPDGLTPLELSEEAGHEEIAKILRSSS